MYANSRYNAVGGFGTVRNQGSAAGAWTMVVQIPGVRMTSARGGTVSGSRATFTGSGLAPDKSVPVSFQGTMTSRDVGPVSCTINGKSCRVTSQGIPG